MGKYFSDVVDNAIEAIYYTYDQERAASVLQPLADAANAGAFFHKSKSFFCIAFFHCPDNFYGLRHYNSQHLE